MPEGHTIHRYARLHRTALAGNVVGVSSPQGRFADDAAILDGRVVEDVDARGKHLFYRWQDDLTLHVHLGLFGRFRTHRAVPPPDPTPGTRMALRSGDTTIYLSGPTDCRIIDADEERSIVERLGPDPLADGTADAFTANLGRRKVGIGAALLDQRAVAGIGNVYRAEGLFLEGIHPDTPARDIDDERARRLWHRLAVLLRAGERAGRIVTVDPAEVGAASARDLPREERLYVYQRAGEPCRRCGTDIRRWESAGRKIWACERCQA
ncbi:MAG TPA: DNA-formamidopyrimidine glycosylase family protein [Acidimicrobiia bacterium]|nr:DNA-formamidopyrimidine glycosylase family protein [Acidimicrobiia bacterium]